MAQEVGVNRYERITDPELDAAEATWAITAPYWEVVRVTWSEIFREQDRFRLKPEHDGRKLFELHFAHAAEIEQMGKYDASKWDKQARDTVLQFLDISEGPGEDADY